MTTETKKEPVRPPLKKHDEFVRFFLSEKETAISFFQNYLPLEITRHMDFTNLSMPKDSFLNKRMARYYSDILYEVRLKETPAFMYCLIEHKRKKEPLVGFQLLKYMVRIWELFLKQHKNVKKLPLILPIVIYHGETEWKIDTQFISLVDVPENLLESVWQFIPNFNFNLQDISHMPDEKIKDNVLLEVLYLTLKYVVTPELQHKIGEIIGLFKKLKNKEKGIEHLEVLLHYLSSQLSKDCIEIVEKAIPQYLEEGGDVMITMADAWKAEGAAKEREKAAEGAAKERENTLWEIIKKSFKKGLPLDTISEITGLTAEQINQMKKKMAHSS